MKTRVSLKCFVNGVLCKQLFASNSPPDSSKFSVLNKFGNSKAFNSVST